MAESTAAWRQGNRSSKPFDGGDAIHRTATICTMAFVVVTPVALLLALAAPPAVTVGGLVLFGVLHNYFELRYVVGQYVLDLPRGLLVVAGVLITLIVLGRLFALGRAGELSEIVLGYALIVAALWWSTKQRPRARWVGLVGVVGAATLSLHDPSLHFVALTHLHNLVPLVFLWWWSSEISSAGLRRTFRSIQSLWSIAIPVAILAGAFDQAVFANLTYGSSVVGDVDALARRYAPAAWSEGPMPIRMLTAFAFLQTMHYAVWCGFFPRVGRSATQRLEVALDARALPAGGWLLSLTLAIAATVGLLIWIDYAQGRSLYAALASYHAYIEFPVLLMGVLALGRSTRLTGLDAVSRAAAASPTSWRVS